MVLLQSEEKNYEMACMGRFLLCFYIRCLIKVVIYHVKNKNSIQRVVIVANTNAFFFLLVLIFIIS